MTEISAPEAVSPREEIGRKKDGEARGRISPDSRRNRLLNDYLFAPDEKTAEEALDRLTIDGRRAVIGGMTPEQRARAAAMDELKKRFPGLVEATGVTLASAVVSTALVDKYPVLAQMFAVGGTAGFLGAIATERGLKFFQEREKAHPRLKVFAEALAVGRTTARITAEISAGIAIGTGVHGIMSAFEQQAAAGGGEGGTGWEGITDRGADMGRDLGDLRQRPEAVIGGEGGRGTSLLSPSQQEFVDQVGHPELREAQDRAAAELAADQAAEAARQTALEAATRVVEVQPGDTLTDLVARAGGDAYGADFTNTVLQSEGVLTGPQNPNRDMAAALVEFIKAHPDGVNWRDAINGVGSLAKELVGGVPLKDAIAQATRMIYSGQEMKVVVGAVVP